MKGEKDCVRLKVLRCNQQADKPAHQETYTVPFREEKMSLLQALEEIYREQDETLAFRRYSCGVQYCNSCLMLINGKPAHACLTILKPGDEFEVAPLRGKEVLKDLIVREDD